MAKKVTGVVTSDIQDKTIVVTVTSRQTHPLYGKQYTETRKFTAHDEKNQAKKGDVVDIVECRPISKHKTWKLERIVEAGHAEIELEENEIVAELEGKSEETEEKSV
jgi:small subunit ribosomal protein S17